MNRHAKAPSSASSSRQGSRLGRVSRGALATRGASGDAKGTGAPSTAPAPKLLLAAFLALAATLILAVAPASATAPAVTLTEPATDVEYSTAHLEGEINPEGEETSYRFEYIAEAQYLANVGAGEPAYAGAWQTTAQSLPESAGLTPVDADLTGLAPETPYYFRLVASNGSGPNFASSGAPFTTKGPVIKPTIENLEVTAVAGSTAHFSAEVDPHAPEPNDPAFDAHWHFECTPACGGLSGGTVSGGPEAVENDASGLQPNTLYTVRLFASNLGGEAKATETFTTPAAGPLVKAWAAGPVASTTADINAQVDPQGSSTVYWFEWGTADCSTGPCTSIPAEHDASAGAGQTYAYVLRHLTGLSPDTTYHFRVVAKNDSGTTTGGDQTFTTAAPEAACANAGMPGTDFLPDCRAYEMVSPTEKNGQDVIPNSFKTVAATEGSGVAYVAVGAFGDVKGTATDVQYVARRTGAAGTAGWATTAVNPPGQSLTLLPLLRGAAPSFEAFTPDLRDGIFRSWRSLTDAPNVAGTMNDYRLRDLEAGQTSAELLSASAAPLPSPRFRAWQSRFAGASEDLTHVILQSPWNLTGDGSFSLEGDLYEQVEGLGLRRVGRIPSGPGSECDDSLPGSECVEAPPVQAGLPPTLLAGGSEYSSGMISADGSRILFKAPAAAPGETQGTIYMREDGERTYQLNASERTSPASPQAAQLWGMSEDGSRVFFTTGESLVQEDEDGGSGDLYMYEAGKPAGHRLTLLSTDETGDPGEYVSSVVGSSGDGNYVYFVSGGQLVAGEPSGVGQGLYLWHDGQISYIGAFEDVNVANLNTPATTWQFATTAKTSRVTPDGRHLLFMSTTDAGFAGRGGYPGGYDHGSCGSFGCRELYLYSAESGRLACVSCNPAGAADPEYPGDAVIDVLPGVSATPYMMHESHALSDDGRHAFFSTAESLLPEDTNGKFDAYSYDVATGALHLISSGTDEADSYFMDASADGSDVYFLTRQQLVGWDNDSSYDLYDARVGGGFAEPAPVPAPCEGESCLPATQAAPAPASSASKNAGPGNPKPPRCRKGTKGKRRHGKTRCVKKDHRKHHHRKANANRRAGR